MPLCTSSTSVRSITFCRWSTTTAISPHVNGSMRSSKPTSRSPWPTFSRSSSMRSCNFVKHLEPIGPDTFLAERLHLYAFESDDWQDSWGDTLRWKLLDSWVMGSSSPLHTNPS